MVKTPLNILLIYGLVGLAIAGGVVTVTEVTSKVVPVFPRNGQLAIDLSLSTTTGYATYSPLNDNGYTGETYTLRITAESVTVYRPGTFNLTGGWTTLEGATRMVTLRTGVKVRLGGVTVPEGNVTVIRVRVVDATVQGSPEGAWENIVGMQSSQFDLTTHARVKAQTTTDVLLDFHLECPSTPTGNVPNASEHGGCTVTPSAENED